MIIIEIDIELYKIFYTVALHKNITKASKELYISQPAVTMNIKKLEQQLDVNLFIRTKRGVVLTNEGNILFEYIKQAMEIIQIGENKINSLKKLESGNIRIGIGSTLAKFFLVDYLNVFHEKYPNITINIDTSMTKTLLTNLNQGKIDIAIITSEETGYKGLKTEYREQVQDIFVANKDYIDKIGNTVSFQELSKLPLILQSIPSSPRRFIDNYAIQQNTKLNSIMDLASYSLVIEFTKIGLGIGFTNKNYVKKELQNHELFELQTIPKIPKRNILVLTKKDFFPNFSTAKLLEIIKNHKTSIN